MTKMDQPLCIPNIGSKERKRCYIRSVAFYAISLILAYVFILNNYSLWWRLLLIIPVWMGSMAFFIAREKT